MTTLLDKPDTIVPTEDDAKAAAESSRILAPLKGREFRVQLDDGSVVTLPKSVGAFVTHVLLEMAQGNAVTLIPIHAELTTQEAADYLGVSRPYLVGLLEEGKIDFRRVGTHRRVRFEALKQYKAQVTSERKKALAALAEQAQELKMGYE